MGWGRGGGGKRIGGWVEEWGVKGLVGGLRNGGLKDWWVG